MREFPIELAGLGVERAWLQGAIINPDYRNHFRIIPRREDLVRRLEFLIRKSFLHDFHTASLQEPDYSLTRNPRQESSIRDGCKNHTALRHENVRRSEFGNISQHVADDSIVESASMSFKERTR